jgi:hypothetical protein
VVKVPKNLAFGMKKDCMNAFYCLPILLCFRALLLRVGLFVTLILGWLVGEGAMVLLFPPLPLRVGLFVGLEVLGWFVFPVGTDG